MTRDHGSLFDADGRLLVLRDSLERRGTLELRWDMEDGVTVLLTELDGRGARRLRELLGRALGEEG